MAADGTATKVPEENPIPEDEVLGGGDSTEETEDDEEEEFEQELLDLAASYGVDPDDFETAKDLEAEIVKSAGEQYQTETANRDVGSAAAAPEELALEAYKLKLSGENIDEGLIAELQEFSKAQTAQFTKVLNDLRAQHRKEIGALTEQVKRLTGVTDIQVRQNDFRLVDEWRRKNEKAQAYYGEENYGTLDQDSRPARRMRSLLSKAYRLRGTYTQQQKRPPSPNKLFDMAFAATARKGKGKDKPPPSKTPTKAARATGSRARTGIAKGEGKTKLTEEQQLEEAGAKVEEWQRQRTNR